MDERTLRRHRLALAGLLHDLGKLAHRAGEAYQEAWADPANRRDFRYAHALLTERAVRELVPAEALGLGPDFALLAGYHHAPKNPDQAVIRLADQLSAGERASGDAQRDDSNRGQHPRLLHPIFTRIHLPDDADGAKLQHPNPKIVLPLGELRLAREALFPRAAAPDDAQVWAQYEHLWQTFQDHARALRGAAQAGALDLPGYLEAMQALMMRTTWAVPAAYWKADADISLYDHSRMTAALAAALADLDAATVERLTQAWRQRGGPGWDEPVALLIGGDISGVQAFIYTIAAKGAAKSLRGRSFYLQLLTEAVLRFVLRALGLPYTSVIYSGGGNFYLLAPLSAREALPNLRASITERLWTYHRGDVYLVLGSQPVPLAGFQPGAFPEYWGQMHRDIQARKAQRYTEFGDELHARVFAIPQHGGNPEHVCSVCGSETRAVEPWDEWQGQERICTLCRSFVRPLGEHLAHGHAVRWRWVEPQTTDPRRATYASILRAFGAEVDVLTEPEALRDLTPSDASAVWMLDDPEDGVPALAMPVWLRYAVTQIPKVRDKAEAEAINARLSPSEREEQPARPGQPKTFTHLQAQTVGGFHRLGVLRMDVDHLGRIFRVGLGKLATLSRLAALSFQMSLFFEGWVERILAGDDPLTNEPGGLKSLIYAVYAGGDDLFLIGPWDRMPYLALRIVDDFTAYTGGHPGLHLSGGLTFIHGKYPIYQAAEDAGEAEEQAKAAGRNRFTFLGRVWTWDEFRHELMPHKDELVSIVQQSQNKALLRTLRNLALIAAEAERAQREGRPTRRVWNRWQWLAAYRLSRIASSVDDPALRQRLLAIRDSLLDLPTLRHWAYAARWAELELRG